MHIFVGNLSHEMDELRIEKVFKPYGLLKSVKLANDLGTGRFRGYAFVEMYSESEGLDAIKNLNNKDFLGKRMVVNKREQ